MAEASGVTAAGCWLQAEGQWLQQVTAAWQLGRVSNLDYLLYLNLAAGRSFNDLAQWCAHRLMLDSFRSLLQRVSGGWQCGWAE